MSDPSSQGPNPIPQPNLNLDPARERMLREYEREQEARRLNASKSHGGAGLSTGKRIEQIVLLLLGLIVFGALSWSAAIFHQRGYLDTLLGKVNAPPSDRLSEQLRLQYPLPEQLVPMNKLLVNWDLFPENIVPDQVTVNKAVVYKLVKDGQSIGSTSMQPGHTAKVIKRIPNWLILSINPQNTLLAQVSPFDTSAGPALEAYFKQSSEQITRRILAARKIARQVITRKPEPGGPRVASSGYGDPGSMMFQPVNAFILQAGIPGRKLEDIVYWGYLGKHRSEGQLYDEVAIFFKVDTLYGPSYHVMICRLQDRVVRKWVDPSLPEDQEAN